MFKDAIPDKFPKLEIKFLLHLFSVEGQVWIEIRGHLVGVSSGAQTQLIRLGGRHLY